MKHDTFDSMDHDQQIEQTMLLLIAIEQQDIAACKEAIRSGALMDTEKDVPTVFALVGFRDAELLSLALQAGAAINARESKGLTALYWAVAGQDSATAQLLIEAGATVQAEQPDDGYTSVHCAAEDGNNHILPLLIDKADGRIAFSTCDYIGRTPLAAAAHKGKLQAVRILIKAGHDLDNACDDVIGDPPIRRAAQGGYLDVVRELLDAGADPLRTGWMQLGALYDAQERHDDEMVALLQAAIEAKNRDVALPPTSKTKRGAKKR